MRFEVWEPFYEAILEELGYSRDDDRTVARLLERRVGGSETRRLGDTLNGTRATVVGNAPSLEPSRVPDGGTVVAADGAAKRLDAAGVGVDAVVTDLDGAPRHAADASCDGVPVVVHAHGDNRDELERHLPVFDTANVVGTTQTRPFGDLHNFGGFTDGDRAAFLADEFGATRIDLVGFDFGDASGEKREKLRWARRLLRVLSVERGERLL